MIQLFPQRPKRFFNFGEIQKPTRVRINLTLAHHFHAKAMPVQPMALVTVRHMGQPMGRLKGELPRKPNPVAGSIRLAGGL